MKGRLGPHATCYTRASAGVGSKWENRHQRQRHLGRPESKHKETRAPGQKPCPLSLAHEVCPRPPMSREPPANSLPNLINDSLLLLNLITKSGQLLLVRFPVTLHLLLQSLLQARPGEMWRQLAGTLPVSDRLWIPIYLPQMLNPNIQGVSGSCAQAWPCFICTAKPTDLSQN